MYTMAIEKRAISSRMELLLTGRAIVSLDFPHRGSSAISASDWKSGSVLKRPGYQSIASGTLMALMVYETFAEEGTALLPAFLSVL